MIYCYLLINRQGKVRLTKWYETFPLNERSKLIRDISVSVIGRTSRLSNFLEWQQYKIVYKRYASLYFIILADKEDNELIMLELIHHYVESLDRYFGNVCELDIIFNFHKAYYILEEIVSSGYIQESNKRAIMKSMQQQDSMLDEEKEEEYNVKK